MIMHHYHFHVQLLLLFGAILVVNLAPTEQKQEEHEHVYLWKITHPQMQKPSYLLGTMNVPWKILYKKIPTNIERVLKQTDHIVTEIDSGLGLENIDNIDDLDKKDPEMLNCMVESILRRKNDPKLPDHTLARLLKVPEYPPEYVELPLNWQLIFLISSKPYDFSETNREFYKEIENIGKKNGKSISHLEQGKDVCGILQNVGSESLMLLIEQKLAEIESDNASLIENMVEWYKNGVFAQKMNQLWNCEDGTEAGSSQNDLEKKERLKKAYKEFNDDFYGIRNEKWVAKMHNWMVKQNPGQQSFVFAVTNGHIVISEKYNLIARLKAKGYTVEEEPQRMNAQQQQPSSSLVRLDEQDKEEEAERKDDKGRNN